MCPRSVALAAGSQARDPPARQEEAPEVVELLDVEPPDEVAWPLEGMDRLLLHAMSQALKGDGHHDARACRDQGPSAGGDGCKQESVAEDEHRNSDDVNQQVARAPVDGRRL